MNINKTRNPELEELFEKKTEDWAKMSQSIRDTDEKY